MAVAVDSHDGITDASGRFQLAVDPGRYAMSVTRNGYARQTMGMAGSAKPASMITLSCRTEVTELRFTMTPQGLIIGTVVDEDNEPVANATVEAFSYHTVSQGSRIRIAGSARTDDRGKYRIFGISPGRYYVAARMQDFSGLPTAQEKQQMSYVRTYYPGTSHASAAAPVQVVPGQENEADIAISKVPTVHISGKLLGDHRPRGVRIVAYPANHPSWDPGQIDSGEADDKTGDWAIQGLQPGAYTLVSDRIDNGVRDGVRLTVSIGTKNIDNLDLVLSRYPDLAGKVAVAGGGQLPPAIKVALQPREALASMGYGSVQPNAGGEFFLKATTPDLADIIVSNLPPGYFVKSVTVAGREVSETGIELGLGGSRSVEIVISPNGATLEGSISDEEDKPSAGAMIVLVPSPGRRRLKSAYYIATADQNGGFTLRGIRPGEYIAVAWDSLDSFDYTDPEVLEIAEKQGQTLKLEEGGRKIQLRALPAQSLLP
jgi:hypothetical protein